MNRADIGHPRLSIVVPLYNEEECIRPLVDAVRDALGPETEDVEGEERGGRDLDGTDPDTWELVLVDDGSTDSTVEIGRELERSDPRIRLVQLARNYGQTAAMQAGFDQARGEIIVSMDGDLQNDPLDIPRLVSKLESGYDLVAGYRKNRQDSVITRKIPSWVANRIIRQLTGVDIRDNGCSLKAYRRELVDRLHLYSDMHRFIPALAAATGGARIAEIPVRHHPRRYGRSKYGLTRIAKVSADLLVIKMIRSFREQPLVLFALGSACAFLVALVFGGVAAVRALSAGEDPAVVLSGVAILAVGLSAYLMMLGLIAEVALRKHHRRVAQLPVAWQEVS